MGKHVLVLFLALFTTSGLFAAKPAEVVTGIGGFFFKAKDPKGLAKWYLDNLGIDPVPTTEKEKPWEQEKGLTAFEPFPEKTTYFGKKDWMMNFRVNDLDAMVKQLTANSIKVTVDSTKYPYGRFASLEDPEGNPIQLWEPAAP